MAKIIKVTHSDSKIAARLGAGFITGYTQTVGQDAEGKPVVAVFANVCWQNVRTPAVSFHPPQELVWEEIEGVDGDGDIISNYDLADDEEYEDDEEMEEGHFRGPTPTA
jgi:hypothetical protein